MKEQNEGVVWQQRHCCPSSNRRSTKAGCSCDEAMDAAKHPLTHEMSMTGLTWRSEEPVFLTTPRTQTSIGAIQVRHRASCSSYILLE